MSKQIDEKVVSMRFDNAQFEKNVSTSLSTIDKLKKSLKLEGVSKGLENVNSAAKQFDISPLSKGLETVKVSFSALEVMAVTALTNITNSAINAGKRIVSALTIDPIKTGFNEYELKMNSVQTIMASTGESIETVNQYLEELNKYSDQTIYSFQDMTSNIGKFTNAGVELEDAVTAIKGISNEAAVSGANANEASRAMYNFAQALSSGYVKLIDWKSIENANMATVEFKNELIKTAVELGTVVKVGDKYKSTTTDLQGKVSEAFDSTSMFNDSLSAQWMTTDVLVKTLGRYADETTDIGKKASKAATEVKTFSQLWDTLKESAQSGWAQSWEIIVGDLIEAKSLLTGISDIIGGMIEKSADARNALLKGWKAGGGRTMAIDSLKNAFQGLLNIIKPIKEAFREVFPPTTSEQLLKITERIRDLATKFRDLAEKNAPKLKSTFKGLFSIIKIGINIIKEIISGIAKLISKFASLGDGLLNITSSLGNWISGISESIAKTNLFGKAIDNIVGFLGKAIDKLKEFGTYVKGKFEAPGFDTLLNVLTTIWNAIKKIGISIVKMASSIGKALGKAFQSGDIKSLLDLVNTGIFTGVLLGLKKWISGFKDLAGEGKSFIDTIKEVLGTVGDSLTAWQQNIKSGTLQKIAISIGILAASLWILSKIDPNRLGSALGAITALFIELIGAMKAFDKLGASSKGAGKAATLMIGMSIAVLVLASAVKKLSDLDIASLAKGVIAIAFLLAELVGAAKLMSIGGKNISKGATQMVIMAVALKILASVCKDVSELSWTELAKGVAGIGAILIEFVGFQALMKLIKPKKMLSSALSLVLIGAAMEIFADVCKKFGKMEWSDIGKAGAAISGILVIAAIFGKLSGYSSKMVKSSVALILIGAAMEIFANICSKFGGMSWGGLAKAGAAIGGILLISAIFAKLSDYSKKMISSVIALTIIAAAMEIFADVCEKFGQMDWEVLAKAGAAIGGILLLASGFALLAGLSSGILKSSGALLIMATALTIFVPVLKSLGNMSWSEIAKGLIVIASAFVIIGLAGLILKPIVPSILALSGAIVLLGVGCAAAGIGIMALSIGLGALAGIAATGATAIVAALHIIIVGILELVPAMIGALTDAVIALAQVFIQCVPAIGEAIRVFVIEIVKILVECVPVIAEGALKLVVGVLDALVEYTPQIVDLLFSFLIGILEGIAKNLPALIQSVVNVFKALFSGVIDALNSMDPEMLVKGILGIGFMLTMMAALAAMAALAPAAMIGVLGFGAVIAELAAVLAVLGGLSQIPGLEWLISEGENFLQKIGTSIGQFIGGVIGGIAEGVTSTLPQVGTNLSNFMTNIKPFIEGAKMIDSSTFDGVKALTEIILALTAANILEGLTSWFTGGSSLTKFGEEIAAFAPSIKTYADTVKGIDASSVEASVNAAKCLSELADNLPNSGGLVGFFAGENDIGIFGEQLPKLGAGLLAFSVASTGINPETVTAAASAAKSIAEMADTIPNEGGMVAWFTGDNSIASFSEQLPKLGAGLLAFSVASTGINAENIIAASNAAKALAEMANTIPNEGGVAAWFAGDNSVASFAEQLPKLGAGLLGFSVAVTGINTENIIAASNAAKALADMANTIPNEGGIVTWFSGDNSIAAFASQLPILGAGLLGFSLSLEGINVENIIAASNAAKALAEMSNTIPNEGGAVSWFAGDNSIASFASQLPVLGAGLLGFSVAVTGINAEAVSSATSAAKNLAEMTSNIPNEGGIKSWFSGESGMAAFANQLPILGFGLLGFSLAVNNINAENIVAAANAAKSLAELTQVIPNEGGIKAWFSGESGVAKFASNLPTLGDGLKRFSDSVGDISPENVTAAASAAKSLAEMAETTPENTDKLVSFGDNLVTFGDGLDSYFSKVEEIGNEAITASKKAIEAVSGIGFDIKSDGIKSACAAINELIKTIKKCSSIKDDSTSGFVNTVKRLGKLTADELLKTFKDSNLKMIEAGKTMISKFISGLESQNNKVKSACKDLVSKASSAIKSEEQYSKFKSAGKYLGDGLVEGINSKQQAAYDAGYALGQKAAQGEKDGQKSNSPSKLTIQAGKWLGEGLVIGIQKMFDPVYNAGHDLGETATGTISSAISKMVDIIDSDVDMQPTIRPVVDLSDVESGARTINGMLSLRPSVSAANRVGSINSNMSRNGQNGSVNDITSAIEDLGHKLDNATGDTYNINGITYDDDSNVANAIKTIVRAARVERRA